MLQHKQFKTRALLGPISSTYCPGFFSEHFNMKKMEAIMTFGKWQMVQRFGKFKDINLACRYWWNWMLNFSTNALCQHLFAVKSTPEWRYDYVKQIWTFPWSCITKFHCGFVTCFCNIHLSNVWFVPNVWYIQKPLKDANFLSIYVFVYNNYVCDMCLHTQYSRCAKTWPCSYGSCETKNKQCGSCILTTKHIIQTNYYNILT